MGLGWDRAINTKTLMESFRGKKRQWIEYEIQEIYGGWWWGCGKKITLKESLPGRKKKKINRI